MKTVEEYLNVALGGNMNIATLKPKFWHEIMTDYAKHYHKESTTKPIDELIEFFKFIYNLYIGGDLEADEETEKIIMEWFEKLKQYKPYIGDRRVK